MGPGIASSTERHGLVARVIGACARTPGLTILLTLGLGVWGWMSLRRAPLDAIPDLSDVQVILFTEWDGRGPDLVEDQITYPISQALIAAPRVQAVRGLSMFGLSFVYVIFEEGTDLYWARSRVLEYMSGIQGRLPEGVVPTMGPDATGVGWVFQYALVDDTGRHDLQQLRALQDWNLRYAIESVEGVAEVASVGGFVKQYQVHVDPNRLRGYGITLSDIVRAVRESNEDAGGRVIEIAGHEHVIRGRGYVQRREDLEEIPLAVRGTAPILLREVAEIVIGPEQELGFSDLDGRGQAVGGMVVMRFGENALDVIDAVKARLKDVTLPPGVRVEITYDRSDLIRAAIGTLRRTLIEEMIVVSVIIFLFLLHVRSALVPILTLPLAVLLAFIPMFYQGITANIMSLGGIAVAIGAMVDASIIMIENVHKRLEAWDGQGSRHAILVSAMQEVGPSIFFALLVITVSFLPIFTLQGAEGRLFRPLALTKTYSMAFAAVLAVTLTPALAAIVIRGRIRPEERNPISRWIVHAYVPVVRFVVRRPWVVFAIALVAMIATVPAFLSLGSEFMPPLNEGVILYMPTAPPGMSVTEAANVLQAMDRELAAFPEVARVFGKMGRADTATDPAPIGMVETVVLLKPRSEWREGMTWERLLAEMDAKLRYPGMPNLFWMPIQTRTEMLATGIRSPLGIQVFGDDLATIEKTTVEIERVLAQVPGTRSAFAERQTGGYYVDVRIDREKAARFGVRVRDVNDVIQSALGGMNVSETVEGRERFPINVRYAREFRDDPDALDRILVGTPMGAQIPVTQLAEIQFVLGPPMIRSEDGRLVGIVFVDPGDTPIEDYVEQAKAAVAGNVALPGGVRLEWAGQYRYLQRAKENLRLIVPVTLLIVILLLYLNTRSAPETAIVLLAVPFSLIGAIWLLFLLGYNLSVAVWVGILALAGLDAQTGVVMLLYLTLAHRHRRPETREDLEEAIVEGAARRVRPKLMTVLTMMIGLLPVLWSTGAGADVMKRIAAPMVGGLVTSFLLELTVYPAIFGMWKGRNLGRPEKPADVPRSAIHAAQE